MEVCVPNYKCDYDKDNEDKLAKHALDLKIRHPNLLKPARY